MDSTALLLHVADVIERQPDGYDQGAWLDVRDDAEVGHDVRSVVWAVLGPMELLDIIEQGLIPEECGTTCCIGGHAIVAAPERVRALPEMTRSSFVHTTAALFDLDYDTAHALTTDLLGENPMEVANLLRQLADILAEQRAITSKAYKLVQGAVDEGV